METCRSYKQLKAEERVAIASLRLQGVGVRGISRVVGRSPSTINRELARNASPDTGYSSQAAQAKHAARRCAARRPRKLDVRSVTWSVVLTLLDWK